MTRAIALFLLFALSPADARNCRHLYADLGERREEPVPNALFQPHLGFRVSSLEAGDEIYYRLGHGQYGGVVYRIVPKDPRKPTRLRKEYGRPIRREADLELMRVLYGLGNGTGFHCPEVRAVDFVEAADSYRLRVRIGLEMEDVAGRDLHSLLLDPAVPEPLKKRLREKFQQNLEQLRDKLDSDETLGTQSKISAAVDRMYMDDTPDGTNSLEATVPSPNRGGYPLKLLIKSDNVIVHYDSDLDGLSMTIVDPN